jgi:hypothetical protein
MTPASMSSIFVEPLFTKNTHAPTGGASNWAIDPDEDLRQLKSPEP